MNSALNFLPTIVATLGYSETLTLVLTAPPYRMFILHLFFSFLFFIDASC